MCTHELRRGDGDVPDLAPSHEYRVDGAVRLPEVHLEGVRRGREEALVCRVERDAPVNKGGLDEHACLKTSRLHSTDGSSYQMTNATLGSGDNLAHGREGCVGDLGPGTKAISRPDPNTAATFLSQNDDKKDEMDGRSGGCSGCGPGDGDGGQ